MMKFKVVKSDDWERLERLLNEGWQLDGDGSALLGGVMVILFKEVS